MYKLCELINKLIIYVKNIRSDLDQGTEKTKSDLIRLYFIEKISMRKCKMLQFMVIRYYKWV